MKRHVQLLELSREHHAALKLARDAQRAATSGDAAQIRELAQRVVDCFAVELDPHFCVEEGGLLAFLAQAGESLAVQRTLDEHRELRQLAAALRAPEAAALQRFGELLAAHVRFEERELFEIAQARLAAAGVDTFADAIAAPEAGTHRDGRRKSG